MMKLRFYCLAWLFMAFVLLPPSADARTAYRNLPPGISALVNSAEEKGLIPGDGAVILEKATELFPQPNGNCLIRKRVKGVVLDQRAASDYGQISSGFNSHFEEINLDYARTYGQDRDVLDIAEDAVQINTPAGLSGAKTYSDLRVLTFSLPGLAPGTVFEYQITIESKPVIPGGWSHDFDFHFIHANQIQQQLPRVDPVLRSKVLVDLPDARPFNYHLENSDAAPLVEKTGGSNRYLWVMEDLAPITLEANMPSLDRLAASIRLSSFDKWAPVDAWAFNQFWPNCVSSPAIERLVRKIAQPLTDPREKIEAIFNHVQSRIEYVMADFGRSGFRPHPAGQVLENGYGDCKDQTALLITMLGVAGIKAYPALLVPFPYQNVSMQVPTHAFSHALAYIPMPSGDLWIDATANTRFPGLFWTNQDRTAFIVDGQGGHFRRTPVIDPDGNRGRIESDFRFDGDTMYLDMGITAAGALADSIKALFSRLSSGHQKQSLHRWAKSLHPKGNIVSIHTSDMKDSAADLDIGIKLKFDGVIDDKTEYLPLIFNIAPALNFFSQYFALSPPESRKHDFQTGFRFDIGAEWRIASPSEDFVIEILPEEKKIDSGFFAYNMGFTKAGDTVRVLCRLALKTKHIARAEYPRFYGDYHDLMADGTDKIVYKKQKIDRETVALESRIKGNPEDIDDLLKLSGRYLKTGRYSEAHQLLETAVRRHRDHAELYYYFGIALGYMNQYDAANEALEKAKALGYIP